MNRSPPPFSPQPDYGNYLLIDTILFVYFFNCKFRFIFADNPSPIFNSDGKLIR